jgi:hypothetical protein
MSLVDRWLSLPMSQRAAEGLRHENSQTPASFAPMPQKSQMSQQANVGTSAPVRSIGRTDLEVIAPAPWYEHIVTPRPEETPYDQPSPARRGRIERAGPALLHFCIICGAWGSFGYGVTPDRPGLWYCGGHRPNMDVPGTSEGSVR